MMRTRAMTMTLALGLAGALASACSNRDATPGPMTAPIPDMSAASTCGGGVFLEAPFDIKEGTNPEIEGWQVGVSNIWKRDIVDELGERRKQLTAQVARFESKTERQLASIIARAGMRLELGDRRYCVTSITDSKRGARGKITLRRLE